MTHRLQAQHRWGSFLQGPGGHCSVHWTEPAASRPLSDRCPVWCVCTLQILYLLRHWQTATCEKQRPTFYLTNGVTSVWVHLNPKRSIINKWQKSKHMHSLFFRALLGVRDLSRCTSEGCWVLQHHIPAGTRSHGWWSHCCRTEPSQSPEHNMTWAPSHHIWSEISAHIHDYSEGQRITRILLYQSVFPLSPWFCSEGLHPDQSGFLHTPQGDPLDQYVFVILPASCLKTKVLSATGQIKIKYVKDRDEEKQWLC